MTDIISQTFRRLKNRYESIGDKIGSCPYPVKVFLLVSSAQGVIDNGGYRYFFGSDWPGNLPYCEFVEAYRAIGCEKQANELERVIETFPFDREAEVYHNCRLESGLHSYWAWYHFIGRVQFGERECSPNLVFGPFGFYFHSRPALLPESFSGQPVVQLEVAAEVSWLSDIPEAS